MKNLLASIILLVSVGSFAQTGNQLYKVNLIRAKPGDLLELIDIIKGDMEMYERGHDEKTYLLRHSQGDHWDLMLIYAIPSIDIYFSNPASSIRSNFLSKSYGDPYFDMVSYQEEAFVKGPSQDQFESVMDEFSYMHIEIFTALAGKQNELIEQRKMENAFYAELDHRPNMIFTRVFGPSWDSFTLGGYTDMHDLAGPEIPFETEDAAAKKAGFEGVNFIGSYLRSLISSHHDTLAGKVN